MLDLTNRSFIIIKKLYLIFFKFWFHITSNNHSSDKSMEYCTESKRWVDMPVKGGGMKYIILTIVPNIFVIYYYWWVTKDRNAVTPLQCINMSSLATPIDHLHVCRCWNLGKQTRIFINLSEKENVAGLLSPGTHTWLSSPQDVEHHLIFTYTYSAPRKHL